MRAKIQIRPGTREAANWPFKFSVVPGRGIVKNIPPPRVRVKVTAEEKKRPRIRVSAPLGDAPW